jgi:hypothetical protein
MADLKKENEIMNVNHFENPFKKISNEWKKGLEKMQDNFKSAFHIPSDSENPDINTQNLEKDTTDSQSSGDILKDSESQESLETAKRELSTSSEQNSADNANVNAFQKNWNAFIQNSQQTFKKWQEDWETYIQQNQEKMKARNAKIQAQWEENNQKVKTYFQKQQEEFATKTKKMQEEFHHGQIQSQLNEQKTAPTLSKTWNKMMAQQKKDMGNFQKIQSRLWWKGYFNFVLWILAFVAVIAVILYILQLSGFNVNQFIHTT